MRLASGSRSAARACASKRSRSRAASSAAGVIQITLSRRDIASPCVSSSVSNAFRQRTWFRRSDTVPRTCSLTMMLSPVNRANASNAAARLTPCRFSEIRRSSSASPGRRAASLMRTGGGSGIGGPSRAGAVDAIVAGAARGAGSGCGGISAGGACPAPSTAPCGSGTSGTSGPSARHAAAGHTRGSGGNAPDAAAAYNPIQTIAVLSMLLTIACPRHRAPSCAARSSSPASLRPLRHAPRASPRPPRRPPRR